MVVAATSTATAEPGDPAAPAKGLRAALMTGSQGYNGPIIIDALKPRGIWVDHIDGWLDTAEYQNYDVVIIDGWLGRGKIEPSSYSAQDVERLNAFIDGGGSIILTRFGIKSLNTAAGKGFLAELTGSSGEGTQGDPHADPAHPWLAHLDVAGNGATQWIEKVRTSSDAVQYNRGDSIIDREPGSSVLYHVRRGKGRLIYIGWDVFRFRPSGRKKTTLEQEQAFAEQIQILEHIADELVQGIDPGPAIDISYFDNPYELPASRQREASSMPDASAFSTHPPTRPLPVASDRPMADGPARFVDQGRGDDAADGSKDAPWQTVQHAVNQLEPGQTLYLRGGVYHESVTLSGNGEPDQPITIRSYPGELAVLDAGLEEFLNNAENAWEPVTDGAEGEFRSKRAYPGLSRGKDRTALLGHFAESMIPLQGYRLLNDFRSDNPLRKDDAKYCGPGVWYNKETERIHCRLMHTALPELGIENNYRGETDPRRVPLIIGHDPSPLSVIQARHIRVQDLVLRGSYSPALNISMTKDLVVDGVTAYGGSTCVKVEYTQGLRVIHSAFRGIAAPWTSRGNLKYHAIEARVFSAGSWNPVQNSDFDLAYSEFTDCVDGVFIGSVQNVRFHHNLVDNFTDDAIYLTAQADNAGDVPGGPILIYQNRIARSLTALAFGVGHGRQPLVDGGAMTGAGVWIYRNVFDFRQPVHYILPGKGDAPPTLTYFGRSASDHGSPIWEPMFVYHNTIVAAEQAYRGDYAHGYGGFNRNTVRAVLNNIVVQTRRPMGMALDTKGFAFLFDGNLHWSFENQGDGKGLAITAQRMDEKRKLNLAGFPRKLSYPGQERGQGPNPLQDLLDLSSQSDAPRYRAQHDVFAAPGFTKFSADWREPHDLRLQSGSPATDAGVPMPSAWPDAFPYDESPDAGAIPVGHDGWRIGINGRFDIASAGNHQQQSTTLDVILDEPQ